MAALFARTKTREHGRSMEFMTNNLLVAALYERRRYSQMPYVELHACSAFSFLRGGSFPEQLAEVAAEVEMPALALLDRNGVYGAQRFSIAAREHGVRPIIGAGLSMEDFS